RAACAAALLALASGGCSATGLPLAQTPSARPSPDALASRADLPQRPQGDLYLKLIADLRASGRTHAALAHLDEYDRSYPRDVRAAILRAHCLTDIGAFEQATAIYRRLL